VTMRFQQQFTCFYMFLFAVVVFGQGSVSGSPIWSDRSGASICGYTTRPCILFFDTQMAFRRFQLAVLRGAI
jgi:hypothetical protein